MKYTKFLFIIFCLLLSSNLQAATPNIDWDRVIKAIGTIESGNNDAAIGDSGKAIGRYQIHEICWKDAVEFDKSIGGCYNDCKNPAYAAKIVRAYLTRYGKKGSLTPEQLARVWNGGPRGHKKKATEEYARKFLKAFDSCNK